jgi:hypothetical protein
VPVWRVQYQAQCSAKAFVLLPFEANGQGTSMEYRTIKTKWSSCANETLMRRIDGCMCIIDNEDFVLDVVWKV